MTVEEWYEKSGYEDEHWYAVKDAWDAAYRLAYSDAYADAAYPIGYVLVPVEPTEAMINSFWDIVKVGSEARPSDIYKAMIQAAQESE
jgi:hypothetical protein